jgi:hypothetical protein
MIVRVVAVQATHEKWEHTCDAVNDCEINLALDFCLGQIGRTGGARVRLASACVQRGRSPTEAAARPHVAGMAPYMGYSSTQTSHSP